MELNPPVLVHWIDWDPARLRNLTAAAHMWLTAVIGISCGAAQWPLVIMGVLISVIMLRLLGLMERRLGFGGNQDVKDIVP